MQGFAATTIRAVAERAAVSEQSVYHAFGDKIGLLQAAGNDYASLSAGHAEAAFLAALEAEADPVERIRMVARSSRETWEGGAAELELTVFRPEVRDPRLEQLAETSLAYKHATTRDVCRVLFPDGIRRGGLDIDAIAAFATAVDSAATVTTLRSLGWSMDDWEAWVAQLLTLFLRPEIVDPTQLATPLAPGFPDPD